MGSCFKKKNCQMKAHDRLARIDPLSRLLHHGFIICYMFFHTSAYCTITMICWSRDVLRRQTHNFSYVPARKMKIATRGIMTFEPLFTVVNNDANFRRSVN